MLKNKIIVDTVINSLQFDSAFGSIGGGTVFMLFGSGFNSFSCQQDGYVHFGIAYYDSPDNETLGSITKYSEAYLSYDQIISCNSSVIVGSTPSLDKYNDKYPFAQIQSVSVYTAVSSYPFPTKLYSNKSLSALNTSFEYSIDYTSFIPITAYTGHEGQSLNLSIDLSKILSNYENDQAVVYEAVTTHLKVYIDVIKLDCNLEGWEEYRYFY